MNGAIRLPFQIVRSPRLGLVRRPVIFAALSGPRGTWESRFLLDSGADISLIPHPFGRRLGLSASGAPIGRCGGIGEGVITYHLCHVALHIEHLALRIRIGWCTAETPHFILGRLDVFDLLDIEFRQSADCIILRPSGAPASD